MPDQPVAVPVTGKQIGNAGKVGDIAYPTRKIGPVHVATEAQRILTAERQIVVSVGKDCLV